MYGIDPNQAKANKLKSELEAKAKSRQYEAHCKSCGISPLKARLLEPSKVRTGRLLRRAEESRRKMDAIKAMKQKLENRFG